MYKVHMMVYIEYMYIKEVYRRMCMSSTGNNE